MPLNLDNFKNNLPIGCTRDVNLKGLDLFKKKLEKHFFAEVDIRKCVTDHTGVELVIEVKCTISFALAIQHFRVDILSDPGINSSFLTNCLSELRDVNIESVDIKELSFLMSDTSIFIQKAYDYSIAQQLDNIMRVVMNEYNHIISRLKEIPLEIHIPVLEDMAAKEDTPTFLSDFDRPITGKDYFTYWGLYFDSAEDTVIYDVEKSSFIFEELRYIYG